MYILGLFLWGWGGRGWGILLMAFEFSCVAGLSVSRDGLFQNSSHADKILKCLFVTTCRSSHVDTEADRAARAAAAEAVCN